MSAKRAPCHPDRAYYCKGVCKACYMRDRRSAGLESAAQRNAAAKRAKDPESSRARCRARYWANLEKERERQRQRSANTARESERKRRWRADNPDLAAESGKRRRAAARARDPEKWAAQRLARKQKRRASCRTSVSSAPTAQQLAAILREPCLYCGETAEQIDHFIPLSRGGPHTIDNLVPACAACNVSKGNKLPDTEWRGRRGVAPP